MMESFGKNLLRKTLQDDFNSAFDKIEKTTKVRVKQTDLLELVEEAGDKMK
jgi:hypothetical protein